MSLRAVIRTRSDTASDMTIRGTAFRVKQSTKITQDFGKWVVRTARNWLDAPPLAGPENRPWRLPGRL